MQICFKFWSKFEKTHSFSNSSFLAKILRSVIRTFTLEIIYRMRMLISHFKVSTSFARKWNKIKNWTYGGWVKNSLFNAKGSKMLQALRMTICPATVLLFEARVCYPALRVTLTTFYLAMDDLIANLLSILTKNWKNSFFSNFSLFAEILRSVIRPFTLQIIYRIRMLIFHFKAFNKLCSEMK